MFEFKTHMRLANDHGVKELKKCLNNYEIKTPKSLDFSEIQTVIS